MKHLQYFWYVVRHKLFVFLAVFKVASIRSWLFWRLLWRAVVHDLSKFLPSEWFPYADFFYGKKVEGPTGYMHKPGAKNTFDLAWLLHQHRNPHHWQFWCLTQDEDAPKILEMPAIYTVEMVCDWIGAGRATGHPDTLAWYEKNKDKIKIHPYTRWLVESILERTKPCQPSGTSS